MADLTLPGAGEPRRGESHSLAALSRLPSVDRLLSTPGLAVAAQEHGMALTKRATQAALEAARAVVRDGGEVPTLESLAQDAGKRLAALCAPRLTPVFNLTGTVIHTNLGRALLSDEAIEAVSAAMRGYAA
ncbi:MAG: L-seryl-tRNA(Sec) selenium transferase, partial [Burkholderiaceae bacterium]